MARIRTIKPEFWSDEKVVECSVNARLLFIGLWNFADDAGRQEDSPRQIKMKIFPGDDITTAEIDGMLRELSSNGLVIRYIVDGKRFLQIKGWRHQVINKPQKSKFPPCPDFSAGHSGNVPGELPVGMEGNGKEEEGKSPHPLTPAPKPEGPIPERTKDDDDLTDEIWQMANLRPDAFRASGKIDDYRLVRTWSEKGYSADQIRRSAKAIIERSGEIRSLWQLLAKGMPEELERQRGADAGAPEMTREDADRQRWRLRVGSYVKGGAWSSSWGTKPDEVPYPRMPKCEVPPDILAEFGLAEKLSKVDRGAA